MKAIFAGVCDLCRFTVEGGDEVELTADGHKHAGCVPKEDPQWPLAV